MPAAAPPPAIRHCSFPPVVDDQTRVLLLGSLPGVASLAAQRYYAHPQNQFWRLVGAVIGRDLSVLDYEDRLVALRDAGIGLWDVVAQATRVGSLDSAIRDPHANDLAGLAARLPCLAAIGCNGKTAAALARRHAPDVIARVPLLPLPSSSPAFTVSFDRKLADWLPLRAFL